MKRTIEDDFVSVYLAHLGYPQVCLYGVVEVLHRYPPHPTPPKKAAGRGKPCNIIQFPQPGTPVRGKKADANRMEAWEEKMLLNFLAKYPSPAVRCALAMLKYWPRLENEKR